LGIFIKSEQSVDWAFISPLTISHFYFLFSLCLFIYLFIYFHCAELGTMKHFQKFLQYINHIILNSFPPSFFIPSFPHSWDSFNRSHFFMYIHVYTVFELCSPFHSLSLLTPHTGTNPQPHAGPVLYYCFLILSKKKVTFLFV
jgi:hypothetical protein